MGKRLLCILFFGIGLLRAQTPEELLLKIYAEELETVRQSRLEYVLNTHGVIDFEGEVAAALDEAVIRDLDRDGATLQEYLSARSLATRNPDFRKFIYAHRLPDDRELALFNGYVAAELVGIPIVDGAAILFPEPPEYPLDRKERVKVRAEAQDPVTGGKLWTFANGVRVVYKKADTKGRFSYGISLRGGESVFTGDLLAYFNAGGLKWYDFRRMLALGGIEMDSAVSISDLRITGSAPTDGLPLLLASLGTLAKTGTLDREAFELYRRREQLRLSRERNLDAVVDSLMRPGYAFSEYRYASQLTDDTYEKAVAYYGRQFSRFNDGVIVFIGDLDEEVLKKALGQYLGSFPVSKSFSVRPQVQYSLGAGWNTFTVTDPAVHPSVSVALSAVTRITADSYVAYDFLKVVLERELQARMDPYDIKVSVGGLREVFPLERISVVMTFTGMDSTSDALKVIYPAVQSLIETPVRDDRINLYKSHLSQRYADELNDPATLMGYVFARYSENKDFIGGYQDRIKKLSAKTVVDMLSQLCLGLRIEYIVRNG